MIDPTFALVWADIIHRDIKDGGKPPPTPDPECAPYYGDFWHITDEDIDLIRSWVEQDSTYASDHTTGSRDLPL